METQFDTVFGAQSVYRLLLDAMARPGKINTLPVKHLCMPEELQNSAAAVALTLFDQETSFCFLPSQRSAADYVSINTGAAVQPVNSAEFILFNGRTPVEVENIRCGSLLSPEEGATLIIMVEQLSKTHGTIRMRLSGPGIKDSRILYINGMDKKNLEGIAKKNGEFPLGMDIVYVDASDHVACVPRSSSMCWEVAD